MKILIIILTMLFLFIGCRQDEVTQQENTQHPLLGTWKLVEMTYGTGIADSVITVLYEEDSSKIVFQTNNSFFIEKIPGISYLSTTGVYATVSDNQLDLKFDDCDSTLFLCNISYSYSFEKNKNIWFLTQITTPCPEGCEYKFKRIVESNKEED